MKIDVNQLNPKSNVDVEKTTEKKTTNVSKQEAFSGYQLDISGTVMDNAAYGGHGKTKEECMQEVGLNDVALQHNYMAVMSNSLSTEDFKELQEEGYQPGQMPVEEAVTVVDEIKVTLAEAGVQVAGYTDTVDADTLEAVTGNKGRAISIENKLKEHDLPVTKENLDQANKALDQAEQITELSDGAKKYMIENELEPTIENTYLAEHSTPTLGDKQGRGYYADDTSGYYAKKADELDFTQIEDQMKKVIEEAGLDPDAMEDAKWLVEKGIPLTVDTLRSLTALKSIKIPFSTEELMDSISQALSEGKDAIKASLLPITSKRILEETRLKMTTEANHSLMKNGVAVETEELEELVDSLKELENKYYETLLGGEKTENLDEKVSLYQETTEKVAEIKSMPIAMIGKVSAADTITLNDVYREGKELQSTYDKANQSYEALKTEIRTDLGDSMKKAFRNVDDILKECGMEVTEDNQKAVRILAYNQMEISKESIEQVREAEQKVSHFIDKMTPANTLKLIRENINPLEEDVSKLSEIVEDMQSGDIEESTKYSEYLWKLEKNQEISAEERDAYIGIYRLFRQIEKTDGAAIGSLVQQNADLTMKNLLTAGKSRKSAGMNYKVDDTFGGLDAVKSDQPTILEQISAGFNDSQSSESRYYREAAKEIFSKLDPSKLSQMGITADTTIDELLSAVRNNEENAQIKQEWTEEQAAEIRQAMRVDDNIIRSLLEFNQPITADNLTAAEQLMNQRGSLYKGIKERTKNVSDQEAGEKLEESIEHLYDDMTDEDSTISAYQELQATATDILNLAMDTQDVKALDLRQLQLLHKELHLAGNLAKEENYEVPVEIDGEMTSINLKIIHGNGEGEVEATMYTEELGSVAAKFRVKKDSVEGVIGCSSNEGTEQLSEVKERIAEKLSKVGKTTKNLAVVKSNSVDINQFGDKRTDQIKEESKTDTKELYQTAKIFIEAIREQ